MSINEQLLAILACPACKGEVRLSPDGHGVICPACRLVYEIRDGIPIMLVDQAEPWEQDS